MRSLAGCSACDIYARGPTAHAPTERPSASSAPCSAAGPTARSTPAPPNEPEPSPAGSTSTITSDHTAPSATNHQSGGWRHSAGTTYLGLTASPEDALRYLWEAVETA